VACTALLHDAVEDHAEDIAPGGTRQNAFTVLASRFGARTADLVAAVTNPVYEPGRDEHEQYRERVAASLAASPWARIVKASDLADNAVGLFHTTGPKLSKLAAKYRPLLPVLRELILRPDTPLAAGVKAMIAAQLDNAGTGSPRSSTTPTLAGVTSQASRAVGARSLRARGPGDGPTVALGCSGQGG